MSENQITLFVAKAISQLSFQHEFGDNTYCFLQVISKRMILQASYVYLFICLFSFIYLFIYLFILPFMERSTVLLVAFLSERWDKQ